MNFNEKIDSIQKLIKDESYDDALIACEELAIENPGNATLYKLHGLANCFLNNQDLAIKDYTSAIKLNGEDYDAYYLRAKVLNQLNELEEAYEDAKIAVDHLKEDADAHYLYARILVSIAHTYAPIYHDDDEFGHGKKDIYEIANIEIKRAISLRNDFPNAHYCYGVIATQLKNYSLAIREFKTAFGPNEDIKYSYITGLCFMLHELGQDKLVGKYYETALSAFPDDVEFLAGRANYFFDLKEYKKAINDLNHALIFSTSNGIFYGQRAEAKKYVNDLQGALNDFEEAILLEPNRCEHYYQRGLVYELLEEDLLAIEDYSSAIDIDKYMPIYYLKRSKAYARIGNVEESENDLQMYRDLI